MKPIKDMTNEELSLAIAKASGDYSEGYLDRNPQNAPNYIEDMNALMPLVFNHGINFYQSTSLGLRTGNMYAHDCFDKHEVMKCEAPARALAECLLLVLQED